MSAAKDTAGKPGARRYKPYPAYKHSGVEWLGEIPAHWEVKRLKVVASIQAEKFSKPDDATYVGLEHVESWTGRLLLETQPETVESIVTAFKAGDVLFGKLRPYLAKVARPDFDGVCTSELLVLRPSAECVQTFLMYSLLNPSYIPWIDSLTYGTKMPRVSPEQVGSGAIAFPPLPEQRAIAAFLDRETAKIDALVAKKERLIELLQEKRTALITRAVTKGLDPTVPMKDSGVEWLGEIPAHWEVKRLKVVASIQAEKFSKPDDATYVGLEHVESWTGRLLLETQPETVESIVTAFKAGDVLFGKLRPYLAKVARPDFDGVCTSELLVLRPSAECVQTFLMYSLLNPSYIRWIDSLTYGTKMPRVSPEQVGSGAIAFPPLPEQRAIAAFLDRETAKIDALVAKVREAIERLKEYRAALISAAVTGKIDVREHSQNLQEVRP